MNELIIYQPPATLPAITEHKTMAGLLKKNNTYHLRMRTPKRYESIWTRAGEKPPRDIKRSLKTGDRKEALARLAVVERVIVAELDARLAGHEPQNAVSHYQVIAELASSRHFTYRTADEIAGTGLAEIMPRIDSLRSNGDKADSPAVAALLGGVERPRRTLMQLAKEMKTLNAFEVDNKNDQQLHDWEVKWFRVGQRLVDAIGRDPVVDEITREDIVVLKNILQESVNTGALDIESANKDLQYLGRMIRNHHESFDRKDIQLPTAGVRCKAVIRRKKSRKPPIPDTYLQKWVIIALWNGINDELRDIMLICLETGCRESEVFNLPPDAFVLNHPIPHIVIQEEESDEEKAGRQIKTTASDRRVPLVGVALEAARRHPEGFPRYRGNRNFSNAASKSLRARGLIPADPASFKRMPDGTRKPIFVTAGGVRHSFEDRLAKVGVEMDTRGELMGHDVGRIRGRQHYGEKDLEERLELHLRIMIKPPAALPAPS